MEANRPGVMSTQRKCIRRSQGCMAAQGIFHYRCEPTQVKIAISTGDHKGCFAVTVLRCDFLHDPLRRNSAPAASTPPPPPPQSPPAAPPPPPPPPHPPPPPTPPPPPPPPHPPTPPPPPPLP